jgi:hypothetical protein
LVAAGIAAICSACLPKESCAPPPARTHGIVFGRVTTAPGTECHMDGDGGRSELLSDRTGLERVVAGIAACYGRRAAVVLRVQVHEDGPPGRV